MWTGRADGGLRPEAGSFSCSGSSTDRYSDPAAIRSVFFESLLFITTIIAGHFNRFCM